MYEEIEIDQEEGSASGYMASTKDEQIGNIMSSWRNCISSPDEVVSFIRSKFESFAILNNINVYEGHRGEGIGTELLDSFIDEAYGSDIIILEADILESQDEGFNLQRWYEDNGFVTISHLDEMSPIMVFPEEAGEGLKDYILGLTAKATEDFELGM